MLAVEVLLQRDVHHIGFRSGAVPVLFLGRDPHRVAGADFPDRTAPQLHPSDPGYDVQRLPERMRMPCRARARLEPHPGAADTRGRRRLDNGICQTVPVNDLAGPRREAVEPNGLMSMSARPFANCASTRLLAPIHRP